ncbi:hypothetical protein HDV05_007270, partial [Chytridiales sp. JEL 0842]
MSLSHYIFQRLEWEFLKGFSHLERKFIGILLDSAEQQSKLAMGYTVSNGHRQPSGLKRTFDTFCKRAKEAFALKDHDAVDKPTVLQKLDSFVHAPTDGLKKDVYPPGRTGDIAAFLTAMTSGSAPVSLSFILLYSYFLKAKFRLNMLTSESGRNIREVHCVFVEYGYNREIELDVLHDKHIVLRGRPIFPRSLRYLYESAIKGHRILLPEHPPLWYSASSEQFATWSDHPLASSRFGGDGDDPLGDIVMTDVFEADSKEQQQPHQQNQQESQQQKQNQQQPQQQHQQEHDFAYQAFYMSFQQKHTIDGDEVKAHAKACTKYSAERVTALLETLRKFAERVQGIPANADDVQRRVVIELMLKDVRETLGIPHYTTLKYYEDLMAMVTKNGATRQVQAGLHMLQCPLYKVYGLDDTSKIGRAFTIIRNAIEAQVNPSLALQAELKQPFPVVFAEIHWFCARFADKNKGCTGEDPTEDMDDDDVKRKVQTLGVLVTLFLLKAARLKFSFIALHGTPAAKAFGFNAASIGTPPTLADSRRHFSSLLEGESEQLKVEVDKILGDDLEFISLPHMSSILRTVGDIADPYLGRIDKAWEEEEKEEEEKKNEEVEKKTKGSQKKKGPEVSKKGKKKASAIPLLGAIKHSPNISTSLASRYFLSFGFTFMRLVLKALGTDPATTDLIKKKAFDLMSRKRMFPFAACEDYHEALDLVISWPAMWVGLYGRTYEIKRAINPSFVPQRNRMLDFISSPEVLVMDKLLPGVPTTNPRPPSDPASDTASAHGSAPSVVSRPKTTPPPTAYYTVENITLCGLVQQAHAVFTSFKPYCEALGASGQPKLFIKSQRDYDKCWRFPKTPTMLQELLELARKYTAFQTKIEARNIDPKKVVWIPAVLISAGNVKRSEEDVKVRARRVCETGESENLGQLQQTSVLLLVGVEEMEIYSAKRVRNDLGQTQDSARFHIAPNHAVKPRVYGLLPVCRRVHAVTSKCPAEIITVAALLDDETVVVHSKSKYGELHGYWLDRALVQHVESHASSMPTLRPRAGFQYPAGTPKDDTRRKELIETAGSSAALFNNATAKDGLAGRGTAARLS